MKKSINFTLIFTIMSFLFVSCEKTTEINKTNSAKEEAMNKTSLVAKQITSLPIVEQNNIINYFNSIYKLLDQIDNQIKDEGLQFNRQFNSDLTLIKNKDELVNFLKKYKFKNQEKFINNLENISNLRDNFAKNNKTFISLSNKVKVETLDIISSNILESNSILRTYSSNCEHEYNKAIDRAKRDFAKCGCFAVLTAACTGYIGGVPAALYCMADYRDNISDAREDYRDCIKNH